MPVEQALSPRARAELCELMGHVPIISGALDKGGWICGGYARQLLLDRPTNEYLHTTTTVGKHIPAGDIDIFFNSVEDAAAVIPRRAEASHGGFAKEINAIVRVQFVDDPGLIKPTIEQTLESFDIVNCRVAINHSYVVVSDDWQEIESKRLLRVGRNDTPFLGGRILKYLNYRGLEGLTEDSYEVLTGWFAHAANDFKEGDWQRVHLTGICGHVKALRRMGLVRREDLIFFISKWKDVVNEGGYGSSFTYEIDWALNELGSSAA